MSMSSTEASVARSRAFTPTLQRLAYYMFLLTFPAGASGASAGTLDKTYFFATRDACMSSGVFSNRECVAAFANARAQLRDLAPHFTANSECRLHFRLCEVNRSEPQIEDAMSYAQSEDLAYTPTALGVEIVVSANGVEAAPTLAVETPTRLFPYFPVSRAYEAQKKNPPAQPNVEQENAAILSADHFEPFSKRKPFVGAMTFSTSALGAIERAAGGSETRETREARRFRLRNAPFVE